MNSLRPARAARDVDLQNRQKAREPQLHSNSFATRTTLTNHLPVESSGNSYQLLSKEVAGKHAGEPQAHLPALALLTHRVLGAHSSLGLQCARLHHRKKINVKRVNC